VQKDKRIELLGFWPTEREMVEKNQNFLRNDPSVPKVTTERFGRKFKNPDQSYLFNLRTKSFFDKQNPNEDERVRNIINENLNISPTLFSGSDDDEEIHTTTQTSVPEPSASGSTAT